MFNKMFNVYFLFLKKNKTFFKYNSNLNKNKFSTFKIIENEILNLFFSLIRIE